MSMYIIAKTLKTLGYRGGGAGQKVRGPGQL